MNMMINVIMKKWKEVNEPFEDKVEVTPIILCPCADCTTYSDVKRPTGFDYQDVLRAKEKGKRLQCNKSFKDFAASDILKGVYDETTVLSISSPEHNVLFERRLQELNRNSGLGTLSFEQKMQARNALAKDLVEYFTADRAHEKWKEERGEMLPPDVGEYTSDINEDNPIREKETPPVQVIVNNNPPQNPPTKSEPVSGEPAAEAGKNNKERFGFIKWLIPVIISLGILTFAYLNYFKEQPENTNQTETNEIIHEEQVKPQNETSEPPKPPNKPKPSSPPVAKSGTSNS